MQSRKCEKGQLGVVRRVELGRWRVGCIRRGAEGVVRWSRDRVAAVEGVMVE